MGALFVARVAAGFIILVGATGPTFAQENIVQLCPALANEKIYDGDNEDFKTIIAGKEGWIYRSGFDLKQNMDEFVLSEWAVDSFVRLRRAFKKNGTVLAGLMIPTRGVVGYSYLLPPYDTSYDHTKAKQGYNVLLGSLQEAGLIMAATPDVDAVQNFFVKNDNHWTADGARYMAQKMAEAIKATPLYEDLKKTEFETKSSAPVTPVDVNDNFLEFIEEKCGKVLPREKVSEIFTTTRKQAGSDAQALLGEETKPEVVLLGTSNSTEPYPSYANFPGFLREYLGVDIENQSIMGGSMGGAMSNYVMSGAYQASRPKLIVWEMSAHYGFDQKPFFREMIPALYGVCSDEQAIAKSEGDLDPKETMIFKDLGDMVMYSYNYYLVLELENKEQRKVKIDFQHMNDNHDTVKIEHSVRNFPTNTGIYFSELKFGINEPLETVKISIKNGKGKYRAKMCRVPAEFFVDI